MKYRIQVHINRADKEGWFFVKNTSQIPYEYDDENEAYRMVKMCYPNENTRVTDTKGEPIYAKCRITEYNALPKGLIAWSDFKRLTNQFGMEKGIEKARQLIKKNNERKNEHTN